MKTKTGDLQETIGIAKMKGYFRESADVVPMNGVLVLISQVRQHSIMTHFALKVNSKLDVFMHG